MNYNSETECSCDPPDAHKGTLECAVHSSTTLSFKLSILTTEHKALEATERALRSSCDEAMARGNDFKKRAESAEAILRKIARGDLDIETILEASRTLLFGPVTRRDQIWRGPEGVYRVTDVVIRGDVVRWIGVGRVALLREWDAAEARSWPVEDDVDDQRSRLMGEWVVRMLRRLEEEAPNDPDVIRILAWPETHHHDPFELMHVCSCVFQPPPGEQLNAFETSQQDPFRWVETRLAVIHRYQRAMHFNRAALMESVVESNRFQRTAMPLTKDDRCSFGGWVLEHS